MHLCCVFKGKCYYHNCQLPRQFAIQHKTIAGLLIKCIVANKAGIMSTTHRYKYNTNS